ncbi:hypothetical protein AVEN_77432-1 [Araneus ventricosus]|uniref:Uncharacterized protein n=1 Tax=Araneus ventricosus TaxID=182803 RepID=A0A4Y2W5F9_ARAVE|nr:hypothetical protein AVEN_77432-1 [Araneus ventricosus]
MELILNRSLQSFVCQLHANELPIRHHFAHVDKTTTGPRSLTGEIRKSLAGCEKLSVVSSRPIETTLWEVTNKKDLIDFGMKKQNSFDVSNPDGSRRIDGNPAGSDRIEIGAGLQSLDMGLWCRL